jgi:SAM-dependent methyltransferase
MADRSRPAPSNKPNTFDQFAPGYEDRLADPWRDRFSAGSAFFIHQKCRALLRELDRMGRSVHHDTLVLDVGCGTGSAMTFLRDQCAVIGCDVSIEMLRRAPADSRVAVQEPFVFPFRNDSFDVAYAFCVYHHIDRHDHLRHLRELARVVKPGGRVFVFEHNPFNPVTQLVFRRAVIDRGCRMLSPTRLRRLFSRAGLTDLRTRHVLFLPERAASTFGRVEDALRWLPFGGQYYVVGTKAAETA